MNANFKIINRPLRETKDCFPQEFLVRKYILDKRRETSCKFRYEEYLTPIVEDAKLKKIYFSVLNEKFRNKILEIIKNLRNSGLIIVTGLEVQSILKVLQYADTKEFERILIFGEDEFKENKIHVKNLQTGKQENLSDNQIFNKVRYR